MPTNTRRYNSNYYRRRVLGAPTSTVPADPVRDHINTLTAQCVTHTAIARAAGIGQSTVSELMAGTHNTVQRATARLILAVTAQQARDAVTPEGWVSATGARRRIQALLVIGHRHDDITATIRALTPVRLHSAKILNHSDNIERATADAVTVAYNAMWDTPGTSSQTRIRAEKAGFAPPLAWDDDTIDDPAARPQGVRRAA